MEKAENWEYIFEVYFKAVASAGEAPVQREAGSWREDWPPIWATPRDRQPPLFKLFLFLKFFKVCNIAGLLSLQI